MSIQFHKIADLLDGAIAMLPKLATTTDMASMYGLSAKQLNDNLEKCQVIRRENGSIYFCEKYAKYSISVDCPYSVDGDSVVSYLRWTQIVQLFIFLLIKHNFDDKRVWKLFDNGGSIIQLAAP